MEPKDEFVHDYPRPLAGAWKENWYFNFVDRRAGAWGVNHVSLLRHKQKGRFSAFHVVDGRALMYSNVIDIDDSFRQLSDGRLMVEFLEPFHRFRLTFAGEEHHLELEYTARFPIFDYALTRRPGRDKDRAEALEHYEQSLFCRGRLTIAGQTRELECFGHRDHSWGYRNESKITAWNWAAVQFPNKAVNLYRAVIHKAFIGSGFISTPEGNTRLVRMNVEHTDFEGKEPVSSTFTAVDQNGKVHRFRSQRFSSLYLPLTEREGGVHIYENFSDFQNLETGETGMGIDEYLINPEQKER